MKLSHIAIIVFLAAATAFLVAGYGNSSEYVSFSHAFSNQDKEFHVVGFLEKSKPMEYNPQQNASKFTFYMRDTLGEVRKVNFNEPKPNDFERSDRIVVIGKAEGEAFDASKILLKCPSKYNDAKLETE